MWKHLVCGGLGLLLMVAGCSGPQKVVTVSSGVGEKVIQMKASSFDFDPDVIHARQGDRLVLAIENVAGIEHNFTLKNPAGEVVVDEDLPGHEIVRVEVSLLQAGEYPFRCHKFMHAALGMKGRIVVEP